MQSKTIAECKADGFEMALDFMTRFKRAQQIGKNKFSSFFDALRG